MSTTKHTAEDLEHARTRLLAVMQPGSKVFCIPRTRSKSGMQHTVSFYTYHDGAMVWLDGYMHTVCGFRRKNDALVLGGVGLDLGLHAVSTLARKLFDNEGSLKHEWL